MEVAHKHHWDKVPPTLFQQSISIVLFNDVGSVVCTLLTLLSSSLDYALLQAGLITLNHLRE